MSHTYCDTGLPFIMVIPEDQLHLHLLPSVKQYKYVTNVFMTYVCRGLDSNTQPFACEVNAQPNAPLTWLQSTEGRVLMINCCCFFCSVQEYFTQSDIGKSSYHQAKESQVSLSIYIVFDKRHFLLDAQQ